MIWAVKLKSKSGFPLNASTVGFINNGLDPSPPLTVTVPT